MMLRIATREKPAVFFAWEEEDFEIMVLIKIPNTIIVIRNGRKKIKVITKLLRVPGVLTSISTRAVLIDAESIT